MIESTGTTENDILFSSKRFDDSINLSYFGARYYDSLTGRFISRDPLEYVDGPNMYILATNNPLFWIDPFGLRKQDQNGSNLNFFSSGGASLAFNSFSISAQDNQVNYKWSLSTDIVGGGVSVIEFQTGNQSGDPLTVSTGLSKWLAVEASGFSNLKDKGKIGGNVGIGLGLLNLIGVPVNADIALIEISTGEKNDHYKSPAVFHIDLRD